MGKMADKLKFDEGRGLGSQGLASEAGARRRRRPDRSQGPGLAALWTHQPWPLKTQLYLPL